MIISSSLGGSANNNVTSFFLVRGSNFGNFSHCTYFRWLFLPEPNNLINLALQINYLWPFSSKPYTHRSIFKKKKRVSNEELSNLLYEIYTLWDKRCKYKMYETFFILYWRFLFLFLLLKKKKKRRFILLVMKWNERHR